MGRNPVRRSTTFTIAAGMFAAAALTTLSQPSSAVASVADRGTALAKLHAVSASSPTDAWAVGYHQDAPGAHNQGMTKHWDGSRWHVVPSVHPGDYSFLWGVADISSTDAWAVGETLGGATIQAFAEKWNGSVWQLVPFHGPGLGKLNAVSANGSDDVWMVGTGYPGAFQYPHAFIRHWDGSGIHRVKPATLTKSRSNELTGIAAIAADDVWAVGEHGKQGSTLLPLIEHYDGAGWSVVPGDPHVGSTANLAGVDGASSSDAWTVGWSVAKGSQTISALAEHWDGEHWVKGDLVTPGYSSSLTSVSVVATDDAWAVGSWVRSEQDQRSLPLVEHWDGHSWSVVAVPHGTATVESVSMDRSDDGFAVGETESAVGASPYAIRWDGTTWSDAR